MSLREATDRAFKLLREQQGVSGPSVSAFPETWGPSAHEERIFDPALKQYARAFRKGEPAFERDEDRAIWRGANRTALQHILALIAASPVRDSLVLRGSATLASWFGDAAREPRDLDWVVRPTDMAIDSEEGLAIGERIRGLVNERAIAGEVVFWADRIETDLIWTYERVPGRRLSIPWKREGVAAGVVQVDLVFNERMFVEPRLENVCVSSGGPNARLYVASPEESLAWKILWLTSDCYPQGKDLFDAALLSSSARAPDSLIQQVFREAYGPGLPGAVPVEPTATGAGWQQWLRANDYVDWNNFVAEYPEHDGVARALLDRVIDGSEPSDPESRARQRRTLNV
ncbi:MAG: nucleotidyl transferase AbiEii/AbiGii toxin family protein [Polyangiales bacterium]